METHMLMLVAISGLFSYSQASLPPTKCSTPYDKVGGFNDKADRTMPKLLINDGKFPEGKTFEESAHSLVCRCAAKAKEKGYKVFGLQNIVECWSGPDAEKNYDRYGEGEASKFYQFNGKPPCDKSKEQECVGGPWANYVYRLKEEVPAPTSPACGYALGLQSQVVSDSQMSASSEWNSAHRAANGRLHFRAGGGRTGAWSAKYGNAEQWLQVDFRKIAKITKIATQGRQDHDQWVKSYTLSYSRDGVLWAQYPEVFSGNSDRSTVVTHELKQAIYARYLRIHPQSWHGFISLRAEVYGCTSGFDVPAETCLSALGMQDKTIPDSSIIASSIWNANHLPSRARLGTVKESGKAGAWAARRSNANQWIQVDLGKVVKVTGIATQGRQDYNQWVKSYTVQYSLGGRHFEDYQGGRVLTGNSDRNSIVGHILEPAITARYIRIRPKSWYGHISLRFEVYGCT